MTNYVDWVKRKVYNGVNLCSLTKHVVAQPAKSPGKKEITTKHDPVICGRRNVKNLDKVLRI